MWDVAVYRLFHEILVLYHSPRHVGSDPTIWHSSQKVGLSVCGFAAKEKVVVGVTDLPTSCQNLAPQKRHVLFPSRLVAYGYGSSEA